MGLDASVECACRRDGLTRPPPFAPELLIRDEDGWLTLDLPEGGDPEPWRRFDAWMRGCCEHPDMELARVRVASWPELQAFDAALGRAGRELFPTLSTEIPHLNGGTTNPAAAVRALAELALFERRSDLGDNWYLVDIGTGIIVNDYDAIGAGRAFHLNAFVQADGHRIDMGFDPHGVYLVSRTEPPRELFRAMRLEQRAERDQGRPDSYRIEFVDLDTSERFVCTRTVPGGRKVPWDDPNVDNDEEPAHGIHSRRLQVERRKATPADYDDVVGALAQIFRAAIATDNPVRWT